MPPITNGLVILPFSLKIKNNASITVLLFSVRAYIICSVQVI
jgi:hypothetical protein